MGVAAYNRGSRLVKREADATASAAHLRAERAAWKEQLGTVMARLTETEARLRKAQRCRAILRAQLSAERQQWREEQARNAAVVRQLTRIAFGGASNGG